MGGVWERMIGVTRRILDSMLLDCKRVALTHEVLVTFMAEACAIINSRPLTPVSSDPECTEILTPSTLLTQKTDSGLQPLIEFDPKNMYRAQWQRVQTLADIFWTRWKNEFLHTMQQRCKWQDSKPDLKPGDLVLLIDDQSHRNHWPMGLVNAIPSKDGKIKSGRGSCEQ